MRCVANKAMLELLWARRVYQGLLSERWVEGDRLLVPDNCVLEPFSHVLEGSTLPLALGSFSYSRTTFESNIRVGRYSSLASGIRWMGADHPSDWASTSPVFYDHAWLGIGAFQKLHGLANPPTPFPRQTLGVTIGNDVWIGDDAMLAPGITIGHGAIIGARALVREDVPPYAIVVGQPARVLRLRFPDAVVARFLELAWWRFSPEVLQPLPVSEPERFLDALEARIAADPPAEFQPAPLLGEELLALADPE